MARLAVARCRIQTEAEADFARSYLKQAGYTALRGVLREKKGCRDKQNEGHAITESPVASLAHEAFERIGSIAAALDKPLRAVCVSPVSAKLERAMGFEPTTLTLAT